MNLPLEALVRDASSPEASPRQVRAAARLMTLLERDPRRLPELLPAIEKSEDGAASGAMRGPRLVLGITGAPGTGKSTLTDVLVTRFRERQPENRIGVIAVDPSSPFSGGALLGDRIRMMRHATDPHVFVRSLATRGRLGGLSLGVRGVLRVMGLIGCDLVIIETVGVGQSEVEIARVADLVLIVLAPGHGDSVQLLKAGLLEAGDVFVVNKADQQEASRLHAALLNTLNLSAGNESPVFLVSASDGQGLDALMAYLESEAGRMADVWRAARRDRTTAEVEDAVLEEVRQRALARLRTEDVEAIMQGVMTVAQVADRLQRGTE